MCSSSKTWQSQALFCWSCVGQRQILRALSLFFANASRLLLYFFGQCQSVSKMKALGRNSPKQPETARSSHCAFFIFCNVVCEQNESTHPKQPETAPLLQCQSKQMKALSQKQPETARSSHCACFFFFAMPVCEQNESTHSKQPETARNSPLFAMAVQANESTQSKQPETTRNSPKQALV